MGEVGEQHVPLTAVEIEVPQLSVAETNMAEFQLLRESDLPEDVWVERYGERFRQLVEAQPELRILIRADVDKAIAELKRLLYQEASESHAA